MANFNTPLHPTSVFVVVVVVAVHEVFLAKVVLYVHTHCRITSVPTYPVATKQQTAPLQSADWQTWLVSAYFGSMSKLPALLGVSWFQVVSLDLHPFQANHQMSYNVTMSYNERGASKTC